MFTAHEFNCYLCNFTVIGRDEMAALSRAGTPRLVTTVTVTHGPILSSEETLAFADTHAG